MYCPRCGKEIGKGMGKCWFCGSDLKSSSPEASEAEDTIWAQQEAAGIRPTYPKSPNVSMAPLPVHRIKWGGSLVAAFAVLIAVIFLASVLTRMGGFSLGQLSPESFKSPFYVPTPGGLHPTVSAGTNRLKAGDGAEAEVEITLMEPTELDYKTKAEVYGLRKAYVNLHYSLVAGNYTPSEEVFGRIGDRRPWWGLTGEFCIGGGKNSTDGPSEETRFLANPFLLLALDEDKVFNITAGGCYPVYPRPTELVWYPRESRAKVTYNLTRFYGEKKTLPADTGVNTLYVENLNARDFGFDWVWCDPKQSMGILAPSGSSILTQPSELKSIIQNDTGCGIPGGCNDRTPKQERLYIMAPKVPATLHCSLWHNKPGSINQTADYTYIIEFK